MSFVPRAVLICRPSPLWSRHVTATKQTPEHPTKQNGAIYYCGFSPPKEQPKAINLVGPFGN